MSAFDAFIRLDATIGGTVLADESMARHTSYRIGGPAKLYIECDSVADLALTLDVLEEEGVEWTIVGKGSNLLVADAGYNGAIIVLAGDFKRFDLGVAKEKAQQEGQEPAPELGQDASVVVSAGAGVVLSRLVQETSRLGLGGLEFAVGVPGTLGGALFMNAGTADDWIGGAVGTVTSFKRGEGLKMRRASSIDWSYRSSGLPADEVIVECTLLLKRTDKMMMRAKMEASLKRRRSTQPSAPSCGSVFRNPQGAFSAQLIESCGLMGTRCGDAQVSTKHANFIVNNGSATADQVLTLIHLVRDRVEEQHGIRLRPEVKFLGFAQ